MSDNQKIIDRIQNLPSIDVVTDEAVRRQFIHVYDTIWHEGGISAYEKESINFTRILREKPSLQACTPFSVYFAFIDLAVQGLSLEPGARALAYLTSRSCKVGKDERGNDLYELQCNLVISGYGELLLRTRAGQIRYADNPVLVYEGDDFDFGEGGGQKFVNLHSRIPRQSTHIIACFIKITRPDGTIDYSVMTEDDWKRLGDYSAKNNVRIDKRSGARVQKANDLYTSNNGSIDPAFLAAKCIKHAFKSYPKLNIGKGSQLESESIEAPAVVDFDPYGGVTAGTQEESYPEEDATVANTAAIESKFDDDDTF